MVWFPIHKREVKRLDYWCNEKIKYIIDKDIGNCNKNTYKKPQVNGNKLFEF